MSKTFRPWLVDRPQVLPPCVKEFVPERHAAHFLVRDKLDLSAILAVYAEERGCPPDHTVMMTALLLYGYSRGSIVKLADGERIRCCHGSCRTVDQAARATPAASRHL